MPSKPVVSGHTPKNRFFYFAYIYARIIHANHAHIIHVVKARISYP